MDKINIQIQEVLDQKSQNEYIAERLDHLVEKLKKLQVKEQAYLLRSEEELADVKQLENLGLKLFFKKIIGNLDEQLEKERQEYLLAVMKHKSVLEEIAVLNYEKDLLTNRYRKPESIDLELSQLIKKKEFILKSYDTKFSKELFQRESELGRYKLVLHKATRIKEQAEQTKVTLVQILNELHEVSDWPPSGKAKYASFAKKKYIDKARTKATKAKVRLEEFAEACLKLFNEEMIQYDLSVFENFLDHFYENLITDYIVKSQLEKTIADIQRTIKDMSNAQGVIDEEIQKQNSLIENSQDNIEQFVKNYGVTKGE